MADRKHLVRIKKGVEAWNSWREANPYIIPNLRGAALGDISGLLGPSIYEIDLRRANLIGADLSQAKLRGADLRQADLRDADLTGADLREADLCGAKLAEAILRGADVTGAGLTRADLTRAFIGWTTFGENDLSCVKGLETLRHDGPSTIGVDTIYRSHGSIPLTFLRGAGVPENFIEYMGSLTGKALEFYSCFISYSTKDREFAKRLHADLQDKGVRCWFAPHDIHGGEHVIEQIDVAIRMHERVLLILSTDSMKSKWVETEIVKARKREIAENKRVLFPVSLVPFEVLRDWTCFDSDTREDLARENRKFYIPDFSNWKDHDSYAKALKKLLDGLKAQGSKTA